ncbi:MAG: hemerythrin family protein [Bacteroidales bacterium]|nr:hemerythrin family protein [Bacteroidales bacterium]
MAQEFFEWKPEYSLNIIEIDNQHKKIIELLNQLYEAFMKKDHHEKLGSIIDELEKYAVYHFGTEENYFNKFGYTGKVEHVNEHARFKEKVRSFKDDFNKNKGALTFTVINFLKDWLNKHILIDDKKYQNLFSEMGLT